MREFGSGVGEEGVLGSNYDESVGDTVRASSVEAKNMVWRTAKCRDPQVSKGFAQGGEAGEGEWEALGQAAERGGPAVEREHGRKC